MPSGVDAQRLPLVLPNDQPAHLQLPALKKLPREAGIVVGGIRPEAVLIRGITPGLWLLSGE